MADAAVQREFWAGLTAADPDRIRDLVSLGADVNFPIGNLAGETPLIRAISGNNLGLVRLLIELGADVNLASQGPRSWTPLMFAHDNPDLTRELLAAGADANARTTAFSLPSPLGGTKECPGGATALHLAASTGNAEVVRVLLQAGADAEARAEDGLAPLDYALRLGSANAAAEALVEGGARLTPERLELMHAAAHSPDSDLVTFTLPTALENNSQAREASAGGRKAMGESQSGTKRENQEADRACRCPKCHSLVYSHRARLCGQCGAILPPEMVLTDQQVETRSAERQWARDLADKFGPRPLEEPRPGSVPSRRPALSNQPGATFSPQDLLRGVSCAEEFRRRDRPDFWLSAIGHALAFLVGFFLFIKLGFAPGGLLIFLVLFALQCLRAWNRASPICPNCKRNIRFCPAEYCHICGRPLSGGRCGACQVDASWTKIFSPYANPGNYRWIKYCPGCAAQLDSKLPRWTFRTG